MAIIILDYLLCEHAELDLTRQPLNCNNIFTSFNMHVPFHYCEFWCECCLEPVDDVEALQAASWRDASTAAPVGRHVSGMISRQTEWYK